jgi:hypothetical protein
MQTTTNTKTLDTDKVIFDGNPVSNPSGFAKAKLKITLSNTKVF